MVDVSLQPFDSMKRFPEKLWEAVNDSERDLISWSADGTAIVVNEQRFEREVSSVFPGLVQISSFSNFRRQLREYGFGWKAEKGSFGTYFRFYHPNFRSGRQDLLCDVLTRRKASKAARDEDDLDDEVEGIDAATSVFYRNGPTGGTPSSKARVMRGKISKYSKGQVMRRNKADTKKLLSEIIATRYLCESTDDYPDADTFSRSNISHCQNQDFVYHMYGCTHGQGAGNMALPSTPAQEEFTKMYQTTCCSKYGGGGDVGCGVTRSNINAQPQGIHGSPTPRCSALPPIVNTAIGALQYPYVGCGHSHSHAHALPPTHSHTHGHLQIQGHGGMAVAQNHFQCTGLQTNPPGFSNQFASTPVSQCSPSRTSVSPSQLSTSPLTGHLPSFSPHHLMAWCSPSAGGSPDSPSSISGCLCHLLAQGDHTFGFSPSQIHIPCVNSEFPLSPTQISLQSSTTSSSTPVLTTVSQDIGEVATAHEFSPSTQAVFDTVRLIGDETLVRDVSRVTNMVEMPSEHIMDYPQTVDPELGEAPCPIPTTTTNGIPMPGMPFEVAQEVSVLSTDSEGIRRGDLGHLQTGGPGVVVRLKPAMGEDFEQHFYITTEESINLLDPYEAHIVPLDKSVYQENCSASVSQQDATITPMTAIGAEPPETWTAQVTDEHAVHQFSSDNNISSPSDKLIPTERNPAVSPNKGSPITIVNRPVVVMPVNEDADNYFTESNPMSDDVPKFGCVESDLDASDNDEQKQSRFNRETSPEDLDLATAPAVSNPVQVAETTPGTSETTPITVSTPETTPSTSSDCTRDSGGTYYYITKNAVDTS